MKKNLFPILVAISLITTILSCQRTEDNLDGEQIIDWNSLEKIEQDELFAPIVESMEFIPLETNDSLLLSDIKKIIETDSLMFVLASVSTSRDKELHCFTPTGRHLRKIAQKGEGPGEYSSIGSFAISGDTLMIFDDDRSKIRCYDLEGNYLGITGGFINPTSVNEITPLQGVEKVLIRADIGYYDSTIYGWQDVLSGDTIHSIIRHPFDCSRTMAEFLATGPITNWDEKTKLIILPYSQTLYGLDNESLAIKPLVRLKVDNPLPEPVKGEFISDYLNNIDKSLIYTQLPIQAMRNSDWLIIKFFQGSLLWNISTGKGYHSLNGSGGLEKTGAYPTPLSTTISVGPEGEFIGWEPTEWFFKHIESMRDDAQFRPSQKLIDSLDEDSNPIIIKYKFKKS